MVLVWVYFALLLCLSIYGAHRSMLLYLYVTGRRRQPCASIEGAPSRSPVPRVTVQVPIFNERFVVERVIDAVARLRYPRDRVEVQVLDDSTDETSRIARAAVRRWQARGVSIRHYHRSSRVGFKAGALAEGLRDASGELVAIFDADFVPEHDFLERTVGVFDDPCVGMVQARWGHSNRQHSLLTRLQALLLDAHFVLEHGGRYRGGCFFNFNGTAGVWRRAAIESVGGWHHDTLTEDLDLSYRAQLAGWQFVFLADVVAPAELPIDMTAFKSQQHRWAKGSVQTCIKVLPAVMRAPVPFRVKVEAFFHLTANFNYLLLVPFCLLIMPAMVVRSQSTAPDALLFLDVLVLYGAMLSVAIFYATSQRELSRGWWRRTRDIPALLALSLGLAINNAAAVVEALLRPTGEFRRTPKYGAMSEDSGRRRRAAYGQPAGWQVCAELICGVYFTAATFFAASAGFYLAIPILGLFQFGFLYASIMSLTQQPARGQGGGSWAPFARRAPRRARCDVALSPRADRA